jgi:hypothetical protein
MKKLSLEERWLERVVEPSDDNSCWLWKGSVSSQGYGKLRVEGKDLLAHQIGWKLAGNDSPPKGSILRNQCGNVLCVNPQHWKILPLHMNLGTVRVIVRSKTKEQRMEDFANKINENGSLILDTPCWEWMGTKNPNGYGLFSSRYFSGAAHRASWEIFVGPIPDGLFICHKCDNKSCVNPEHLFLGTQYDNMQDKAQKDRLAKIMTLTP